MQQSELKQKMQVTIKITKWRVMLAIFMLLLVSKVYKYCTQPFMFELFGSQEAAQKYFDEKYPAGWLGRGGGQFLAKEIEAMGGLCVLSIPQPGEWRYEDFEYHMVYACEYYNDYFSIDPFFYYRIVIYTDKENKIIKNNIYRFAIEYLP